MLEQTDTPHSKTFSSSSGKHLQRRHSIAAVVYFLYGLVYLFGAQYLTTMGMSARGMSNSKWWFLIGAIILILFPWLIYKQFSIGLSLWNKSQQSYKTLSISFTLLLGIAVCFKIYGLLRGATYTKTLLLTAGLIVVAINAAILLWAGSSKPMWITRQAQDPGVGNQA